MQGTRGDKRQKFALLGREISYSMSAPLHERMYALRDIDATYEIVDVPCIEDGIDYLRSNINGFNVTKPYKVEIMRFLDEADDNARLIGSVNTVENRNGYLVGHNTDYDGIVATFERDGVSCAGKRCLVIGYGGVARTVVYALYKMGAKHIAVTGRNDKKMRAFVDEIDFVDVAVDKNVSMHYDIVVNATTVGTGIVSECDAGEGMSSGITPIDVSLISDIEYYFDLIYAPRRTPIVKKLVSNGIKCADGLYMLMVQAVKAEEYFLDLHFDETDKKVLFYKLAGEIFKKRLKDAGFCGITLVGFMGSGKSTIARELSHILDMEMCDTDDVVTLKYGAISEIFRAHGENYFRMVEQRILREYLDRDIVLATGGGIITLDDSIDMLRKSKSFVIFLDVPFDTLCSRVAHTDRPLFRDVERARALYDIRLSRYRRVANYVVNGDNLDDVLSCILAY